MECDVDSCSNDKECYKYSVAINDKGEPFPAEPCNHGFIIITTKNDRLANIQTYKEALETSYS